MEVISALVAAKARSRMETGGFADVKMGEASHLVVRFDPKRRLDIRMALTLDEGAFRSLGP